MKQLNNIKFVVLLIIIFYLTVFIVDLTAVIKSYLYRIDWVAVIRLTFLGLVITSFFVFEIVKTSAFLNVAAIFTVLYLLILLSDPSKNSYEGLLPVATIVFSVMAGASIKKGLKENNPQNIEGIFSFNHLKEKCAQKSDSSSFGVKTAIIISTAAIICVVIWAYTYYKVNRYEVEHGRVYDKYENTYTSPDYKE